ncbi:MAG TPA: NADH-ubiquinone oxidoreductase-F iron-sulfur binding region domain-containing protein [Negativicutes bacterium]|nr:NADH-ubiquinone oxidoreductase-F iron-sulfur binding region domain-containing protein [Negativicutes bacterium]
MSDYTSDLKRCVLVCCGTGCIANGSLKVYEEFKRLLDEKGIDTEVRPLIKSTGCNGLCERGPIVKIIPDDISYFKVNVGDVPEIVERSILGNEVVERLLYFDKATGKRFRSHKDTEFYRGQRKIALRNIGEIDPADIDDYIERGGYTAMRKALFHMAPEEVIDTIKDSGLRGRGGAGFPTGMKWAECRKTEGSPKYVICNGDEGDPGAFMDRSIMEGDPNSILEGMVICAHAVGAEHGYIYIRDEYELALKNMAKAIKAAESRGFLGRNIMGGSMSFDIRIVRGGGAFVCGESTALMSSIEGKVGEPRAKYIHSTEKGLWGKPTVLNNVETWANVPEIINRGSQWFKEIGTEHGKGTKVFSLVGKVKNTGLVEVPMGTTLRSLIMDIGGGIIGDRRFKAVQTGGPSGGCIPEKHLDLQVDFHSLESVGSMMGSGGMIVMDDRTCMVEVAKYYVKFLSEESCGKCVPCREGLRRMLEILEGIARGEGKESDLELLSELGEMMTEASLCALGKTAPNPVLTTLMYFRDEYLEHIADKNCPAGVCKALTSFRIDENLCKGCGLCKKNCPADAIQGQLKSPHTIDQSKCAKCGSCIDSCRFKAIHTGREVVR